MTTLPDKAASDALHLAIAAVNGMDFLLTWTVLISRIVSFSRLRMPYAEGSMVMTDFGHSHVGDDFIHQFINHQEEYVRGNVHTNGIENFWSLLKRGVGRNLHRGRAVPSLRVRG
jgi:hypothetical protein